MSISLCSEIAFDHPIMESKSNFLNGKTQNRSDSFGSGEFSFPLFDGNQTRFSGNLLHAANNKPPPPTIDFYSAISLSQKPPAGFPQEASALAPPHNASEVETPGRTSNDPSSNQSEFSNICNLLTMLASSLSPQQRQKLVEKLVQEANASCPTPKEPNSSFQPWNPNGKLPTPATTEESDRGIKNSFSLESSTSNKSLSSIELCFSDPAKFFFGAETNRTDAKLQSSLESLSSSTRYHPPTENHPTLSKSDISFVSSRMQEPGRPSGPLYNNVNGQPPNPMLKDFLPLFGQVEGHGSQERDNSWWKNASRIEEAAQLVNGDKDALLSIHVAKKSDRFSDLIAAAVEAKKDEGDGSTPRINIGKRNKWDALMDVDLPTPNPAVRKSPREIFDMGFDTGDVPPLLKTSKSNNESIWEAILKSPKDLLVSPGKLLSPGSIFFSPRNGDKTRGFGFGQDGGEAFKLQASRFAPVSSMSEPAKSLFPLPQGSSSESNTGNRAGVDPTCDQKSNASDLTFDKCIVDSRLTSQMSIEETSMAVEDKNLLSMNSESNRRDLFGLGIQEAMNMVNNSSSKRKTMESNRDIQSQGFQTAHSNVEDTSDYGMNVESRENGNDTSAAIAMFSSLPNTNKVDNHTSKNFKKAKVMEEESNDKFNLVSRRRELAQNPQAHAARKRRFDVNQRIKSLLDLFPSIRQGDTATMLHEVIENVNKIVGKIKNYTSVEKFEKTSDSGSPHSSFPEMSNSSSFTKLLMESTDPESSRPAAYPGVDLIAENLTSNGNLSKRAMHAAKYRLRKKMKEAERMNKGVKKGSENHARKEAADAPSLHSESTKRVQSLYALGLCLVPRDLVSQCLETNVRE